VVSKRPNASISSLSAFKTFASRRLTSHLY
jgi:hypothetical protein